MCVQSPSHRTRTWGPRWERDFAFSNSKGTVAQGGRVPPIPPFAWPHVGLCEAPGGSVGILGRGCGQDWLVLTVSRYQTNTILKL